MYVCTILGHTSNHNRSVAMAKPLKHSEKVIFKTTKQLKRSANARARRGRVSLSEYIRDLIQADIDASRAA